MLQLFKRKECNKNLLSLNKYFKLIYKDIVVQKGLRLLPVFYILISCFISNDIYNSNLFVTMNMMIASEIAFANISYFYLEEKSGGNLLLTTTSYTRSDIVMSKYLFLILLAFVQLLTAYLIAYTNLGVAILNIKSVYDFILNILFLNVTVALITPLCFFKPGAFLKTIFACIIWSIIECLPMVINFNDYIYGTSLDKVIFISISLSAIIVCASIFISNKVFKSRDF